MRSGLPGKGIKSTIKLFYERDIMFSQNMNEMIYRRLKDIPESQDTEDKDESTTEDGESGCNFWESEVGMQLVNLSDDSTSEQ